MMGRDFEQEVLLLGENRLLPESIIDNSVNVAPSGIRTQNFYEHPAEAAAAARTQEENQDQPGENSTSRNQGQAASSPSRRHARDTR